MTRPLATACTTSTPPTEHPPAAQRHDRGEHDPGRDEQQHHLRGVPVTSLPVPGAWRLNGSSRRRRSNHVCLLRARGYGRAMAETAILDIDGTLVDTNYHHAIAWYRAFRQHGFVLPLWRIHRHVGMGGDQLVAALAGEGFDREQGDDVRAAEKVLYMELIHEVEPLEGARKLIEDLKGNGHTVVLASSAKTEELEHYLTLLDAR